jgi:hypothetical protein
MSNGIPTFPGPRQGSVSAQQSRARAANMPAVIARAQRDVVRNRDVRAAEHVIKGRTKVLGVGEATVEVKFPAIYLEAPTFTFGGELAEGSVLAPGRFPTISAVVSRWDVHEPDLELFGQTMRIHYRGAILAIVTTGPSDTDLYLHWTFTGRALSNPGTGSLSVPPATD